eukprot:scaffold2334_cov357-Prasinococcus_capsulatus_cf.AAC.6
MALARRGVGCRLLGTDEQDHRVWLKRGPYGVYIEREAEPSRDDGDQDAGEDAGTNVPPSEEKSTGAAATKAQRVSLPNVIKGQESDVTLEYALSLLAFPVSLGAHPEDEGDVTLNLGPYGFYVRHADVSATVPKKVGRRRAAHTAFAAHLALNLTPAVGNAPAVERGRSGPGQGGRVAAGQATAREQALDCDNACPEEEKGGQDGQRRGSRLY